MNCPLCGKTYPCVHSRRSQETAAGSETIHENDVWREQVASRVLQHRAKRKGSDPDPNMELRFPVQEAPVDERIMRARRFVAQAATRSPFADDSAERGFSSSSSAVASIDIASEPGVTSEPFIMEEASKLIHFPRSGGSQHAGSGALASVHDYHAAMLEIEAESLPADSLRITDVTEEAGTQESAPASHPSAAYIPDDDPPIVYRKEKTPPAEQLELPNFDDIQLEATHQAVLPELELGPQPAPLGQRMMAGAVDAAIVLGAAAVFNVTFTQLAEENLHSRMALLCAVAVCGVLWTLYQYTFLVHGIGTPGMHLAHLELANFDGKPVSAFDRRCRAVASALSGFSLGLGFLWALVDEDQLGWHDRMTKTLIRSSVVQPAMARESMW
jgi:uncharacterized RDD family membrane protein YckC